MKLTEQKKVVLPEPEMGPGVDGESDVQETLAEKVFGIFHQVLPFLFVCAVVGVGVLLFVFGPREERAGADSGERVSSGSPEPVEPVRRTVYGAADFQNESRLREALIEERGGRIALSNLRSLKVVGTLTEDGMEYPFQVIKSNSGQAVLRFFAPSGVVAIGSDAEALWKTVQAEDGSTGREEVDSEEKALVEVFRGVHGPLLEQFLQGSGRVISVDEVQGEFGSVIRVGFHCPGRFHAEEIDLDPSTLFLLRWRFDDAEGNTLVVHYGDHRPVNGILHPFSVKVWRNGDELASLAIESLTQNFGAVDLLFRNPLAQRTVSAERFRD